MIGAIALGALGLVMYSLQGTSEAMLSGFERLDIASGAKVLNQLAFVVVGAIALAAGMGYYGLIAANLVGVAIMSYACWNGANKLDLHPSPHAVQSWLPLLRASLPFGIIGFTLGLSYKFDSVLLNIFRSDAETGYYNAAYNLVFSAALFSNVFNTSLYPSLARQASSSPNALPRIYERALRYLMVVSLPIAVGSWALADQLVPFLYKASYLSAVPAIKIIMWAVPFMYASEFLGYIVVVAGKENRVAQAIVVSTCINVVANLFLVPRFGVLAAAGMTVATEVVLVGQYVWMLRSLLREFNWGQVLVRPMLAASIMAAMVIAMRQAAVPITVLVGALTYVAALFMLGAVGKDEIHFLQSLRKPMEASTPR
jgi:O-antigen/teichoic acid export membrane protein